MRCAFCGGTKAPFRWPWGERSLGLCPRCEKVSGNILTLETGVPVYPVGQWGSEQILPQYGSKFRPGFWKPVNMIIGDEIDLNNYRKRQLNPDELNQATKFVMQTITELVEELRGEKAPLELWDPAKAGQTTSGNFKKASK